jgi:sulfite reductase (NADPH) flavoprotein alpha-component
MFYYFGYGSNINLISLRVKGVNPIKSEKAKLTGWELRFNVAHWFKHEGGMGNIVPSKDLNAIVEGMVHFCNDQDLNSLDLMEAYGIGYDRITVPVLKADGTKIEAVTYIGLPASLDDTCRPTRRYLSILLKGAVAADLSKHYIKNLESTVLQKPISYPDFKTPDGYFRSFRLEEIAQNLNLTILLGFVFDMSAARNRFAPVQKLFGGKDMTLFHVKRHDSSYGNETISQITDGSISKEVKDYLNSYLNEYSREFNFAGKMIT